MDFYRLAGILEIQVELLFEKHKELYPDIKILDYTVGLSKKEIELLKSAFTIK
jgi:hypothetical protein